MEALKAEDGHNAWDDLAVDPGRAAIGNPLVEQVVVVEELCDYEVGAGIHLLLEVSDIIFAGLCLEMYLGVPSDTNAEKVAVLLSDEPDQVARVVEPVLDGNPVGGTTRGVSSQSKEVLDAQSFGLVEGLEDLVSCHIGAGDVHEDVQA